MCVMTCSLPAVLGRAYSGLLTLDVMRLLNE